jgi:hypothetical protein
VQKNVLSAPVIGLEPPREAGCDFQQVYNRLEHHIETHYGVPVRIGDVVHPNTGDFDGASIQLDYDQEVDTALFVLIHLFGHTVQWNLSDSLRELGIEVANARNPSDTLLRRIHDYERDATRYGLALLEATGLSQLQRWACEWWRADWAYLQHLYRTGERLDPRTLLRLGEGALLQPLAVPPFTPRRFVSRFSF